MPHHVYFFRIDRSLLLEDTPSPGQPRSITQNETYVNQNSINFLHLFRRLFPHSYSLFTLNLISFHGLLHQRPSLKVTTITIFCSLKKLRSLSDLFRPVLLCVCIFEIVVIAVVVWHLDSIRPPNFQLGSSHLFVFFWLRPLDGNRSGSVAASNLRYRTTN